MKFILVLGLIFIRYKLKIIIKKKDLEFQYMTKKKIKTCLKLTICFTQLKTCNLAKSKEKAISTFNAWGWGAVILPHYIN